MDTIDRAFSTIKRSDFLPEEYKDLADLDRPVPIGYGQTNSQPSTVEQMFRWLAPEPGHTILDIGSGSGWTSTLLAFIVGPKGRVIAVEKIPGLVDFGHNNAAAYHFHNLTFHQAKEETPGWPDEAPYDRILMSAAAVSLPQELIKQLKPSGILVVPVKNEILVVAKSADGDTYATERHPGYVFVPFV